MSSVSWGFRMAWVCLDHKGESARGLYRVRVVQSAGCTGWGGAQLYSKRLKCTPAHPPPPPRFTLYTRLPCALYPFSLLSLISCEMASGVQDLQLVVFECLAIKKITPSVAIYLYPRTEPFMNKKTNTILSWMERLTETKDTEKLTRFLLTRLVGPRISQRPFIWPQSSSKYMYNVHHTVIHYQSLLIWHVIRERLIN